MPLSVLWPGGGGVCPRLRSKGYRAVINVTVLNNKAVDCTFVGYDNGSDSTAGLKRNLEKDDNKIIVTTIQKLNNLMKNEGDLAIYNKQVVFIFDECHRSQFGEAQINL
jgi:ERCC4-related helicase